MCGIAGWAWADTPKQDPEAVIRDMCDRMTHRGPDDGGYMRGKTAALGHRRLSIIDLSGGHQPMASPDGAIQVVFNGEIYNFQEIQKNLTARGRSLLTRSDTETLLHLWELDGPKMVDALRGMFAFAIYDARRETVFLARDRMGVKPLLYAETFAGVVFASEMRPMLAHPAVRPVLDREALDLYLSMQYVPAPQSIYKTVRKLMPGHTALIRNGRVEKIARYWHLDPMPTATDKNEARERLRAVMEEAVRIRMIADVPLGAFLSGGIDSSITVGLMSQMSNRPVKTFSIGFEEQDYSEVHYARMVAERYGTDHHEFCVKPDAVALLPDLVRHYGEPYADSSAIPTWYLSRETRKHVTVALSGDGGDETFLGYRRYLAMRLVPAVSAVPAVVRRGLSAALGKLRHPRARQARRLIEMGGRPMLDSYLNAIEHFSAEDKDMLYARPNSDRDRARRYLAEHFPADAPMLQALSYLDMHTYLPEDILTKVDIASMANSLETRSAFLDQEVIRFGLSLPPEWKLPGRSLKHFLIDAFRDVLPPDIQRRPKMGFGVPLEHWFRHQLEPMARELLSAPPAPFDTLFTPGAPLSFLDDHLSHRRKNDQRLWNLVFLFSWAKEFPVADIA